MIKFFGARGDVPARTARRAEPGAGRRAPASTRVTRSFVVALAVVLLSQHVARADTLHVRIVDPQGRSVAHVQLRLLDRTSGQIREATGAWNGSHTFDNVPPGEYLLEGRGPRGSLSGASPVTVAGRTTLNLRLSVTGLNVEVVVTASSTPRSAEEVAKAVDVVDTEDILLRNEMSIAEAVRMAPGVRVRTLRGPGSLTTIQTRGLRSQDTAVLIDGMRFRDAAGLQGDATSFLQSMATVDTERVELMRGSGSSLYGSNAIAGVINITTHTGSGSPHGDLLIEGGGLGLVRTVPRVRGGLADDRLTYSGALSYLNMVKGIRKDQGYKAASPQGMVRYQFSPGFSATGRFWYLDDELQTNESPTFTPDVLANFPASGPVTAEALPTDQLERFEEGLPFDAGTATFIPDQHDPDQLRSLSFFNGSMSVQHVVSGSASYRVSYQRIDTSRKFVDGPLGGGFFDPPDTQTSRFDGRIDTVQARLDAPVGAWNLVSAGYEFEREDYRDASSSNSGSVQIEANSQSFFAQNQLQFLDGQLQVVLGGRLQTFDPQPPTFVGGDNPYEDIPFDSPAAYTGEVSAAYFVADSDTKVRFHLGNSYRAPSLYERFGGSFSSFSNSYSYWGDPRLKPERAVSLDGGVDQWLFNSQARFSATVFITELRETIIFDFANFPLDDAFGRFGGYRNAGGGSARGVEVSMHTSPTVTTTIRTSYTFTDSESDMPTVGSDYFGVLGISKHLFTMMASHWFARTVNVTFDLWLASDYSLSPFGALGRRMVFTGPVMADVVARYVLPLRSGPRMDIYGKVNNLFVQRPYENGFFGPGRWATAGLRIQY